MRIGYFDCFSGVSGDMWVGALLDAGLPLAPLQAAVAALGLPGVAVRKESVMRGDLAGTRFVVEVDGVEPGRAVEERPAGGAAGAGAAGAVGAAGAGAAGAGGAAGAAGAAGAGGVGAVGAGAGGTARLVPMGKAPLALRPGAAAGHEHRGLREVLAIVQRARLPAVVEARCTAVFEAIAEVEARAHGTTVDRVHFHEIGAVDTIVDVVCACHGVHELGLERIYSSAVAVGSGTVRTEHGVLPVPAPGALDLLFGIPVRQGGLRGERTTPTGAALLRTMVHEFEPRFVWVPGARGYGAGTRDDAEVPNLLRLTIGDLRDSTSPTQLVELQCHVDTATGEQLGWLLDEALRRGAVDAFATPVHMKKGRPGQLLTVLVDEARADALTSLLLEESTTLGVRRHRVERAVLERWEEMRASPFGPLRCKVARLPSGAVVARPEDDEVARLCREHGLSRREVLARLAAL